MFFRVQPSVNAGAAVLVAHQQRADEDDGPDEQRDEMPQTHPGDEQHEQDNQAEQHRRAEIFPCQHEREGAGGEQTGNEDAAFELLHPVAVKAGVVREHRHDDYLRQFGGLKA